MTLASPRRKTRGKFCRTGCGSPSFHLQQPASGALHDATSWAEQQGAAMTDPDIAIIGGGPAGLAGAIYLARLRRSVCVVDAGRSRLATIPRTRNFPGFPQ